MARTYRKYTDDDIRKYAAEVKSMGALLKALGLRAGGGSFYEMKKKLSRLNIVCDHWTGQLWNKDQRLKDWKNYNKSISIKPHIIKQRGHKCEGCGLSEWREVVIPIELHHVDGDRTNNDPSNLQLLCCNCHALTHNWKGKKPTKNN